MTKPVYLGPSGEPLKDQTKPWLDGYGNPVVDPRKDYYMKPLDAKSSIILSIDKDLLTRSWILSQNGKMLRGFNSINQAINQAQELGGELESMGFEVEITADV